jgi:riboflavin biosynthesis pyrimidine reductase
MGQMTFAAYCREKALAAERAALVPFETWSEDTTGVDLLPLGSLWTRTWFDGAFYRSAGPRSPDLPVVTLVHDWPPADRHSEGMPGPAADDTARHLIHEGLARVDADAVLGGVGVVREPHFVGSVWHPELVALREARGLPRHPVQIVVTESGRLPLDECILFDEPSLRVVIVTATRSVQPLSERLRGRPWIRVLDAGQSLNLRRALTILRSEGLAVISAVGGRRVASSLLVAGLVTDLYLTSVGESGEGHPRDFHDGPPVLHRRVLAKTSVRGTRHVRFEHLMTPTGHMFAALRVGA